MSEAIESRRQNNTIIQTGEATGVNNLTSYALNRDKLKCRVCGGWLISTTPCTHRVNPYLPLNQVNRVNNLVSMHRKCLDAVNNPEQDISEFDVEAQKKIKGFRDKLVTSHTRNK